MLANIKSNYEDRNLTDVILISDGIANEGISPTYGKYNFNVHAVGFGDTTQKRDIKLNAIFANRIAYLSNKFPIQAEISSYGFKSNSTTVILKQAGNIIDKQVVSFDNQDDLKQITFYVTAQQKGIQRFTVEVIPLNAEFSNKNNAKDAYIDIVDGKEKVLLVALAPHPDLKAFKSIIEKNDLYELTFKIIQSDDLSQIGSQPFDVLILHQLPDIYGMGGNVVSRLLAQGKPTLFVLGNQTNITSFNGMQQTLSIAAQAGKADKVTAKFNNNFNLFNLDSDKLGILERLPPILAPFGDYKPMAGSQIILYQRIGSLSTPKPLLKVGDKSIIKHNLDRLLSFGIDDFWISIRYLGEQIIENIGDGSSDNVKINYIHEDIPLGTIGAVSKISNFEHEYVLVMNSDILTNLDYEQFFLDFIDSKADFSVATIPYNVNVPYAILETTDKAIKSFKEKPTYTYFANAGIYLMKKAIIKEIPLNQLYNATDLLDCLIKNNFNVRSFPLRGYWLDIGKHDDFKKAQEDINYIKF
jgi:dTDP-glucose pyrophosphorylase